MAEPRPSLVFGAWFYESHGIPFVEEEGVPREGWQLIELIPGKYESIAEILKKVDAVLELNPKCDILVLGQGREMLVYDLHEYKQKYWPKLSDFEEHIK